MKWWGNAERSTAGGSCARICPVSLSIEMSLGSFTTGSERSTNWQKAHSVSVKSQETSHHFRRRGQSVPLVYSSSSSEPKDSLKRDFICRSSFDACLELRQISHKHALLVNGKTFMFECWFWDDFLHLEKITKPGIYDLHMKALPHELQFSLGNAQQMIKSLIFKKLRYFRFHPPNDK